MSTVERSNLPYGIRFKSGQDTSIVNEWLANNCAGAFFVEQSGERQTDRRPQDVFLRFERQDDLQRFKDMVVKKSREFN